jgi:hypothetical protein
MGRAEGTLAIKGTLTIKGRQKKKEGQTGAADAGAGAGSSGDGAARLAVLKGGCALFSTKERRTIRRGQNGSPVCSKEQEIALFSGACKSQRRGGTELSNTCPPSTNKPTRRTVLEVLLELDDTLFEDGVGLDEGLSLGLEQADLA